MKKLLLVLSLLISYNAVSQTKIKLLDPGRQAKLNGITGISVVIGQDDTIRVTQPGGALQYLRSNATNDTLEWATVSGGGGPIDTTDITNFYEKVRVLLSAIAPVLYDPVNGIFSVDTTGAQGLATQYDLSLKLNISDTTAMLAPYARLLTMAATYQPLDADLTAIAGLTPSNDDVIQRKAGAWTNRSIAQLKADLAIDSTDISGFAGKVRGLLSGIAPISYNTTTGVISIDTTSATGVATQYDISSKLTIADTVSTLATLWDVNQLKPWFRRTYANQSTTSIVDIDSLYVPLAAYDSVQIVADIRHMTSASNGIRWIVNIPSGAIMSLTSQGAGSATIGMGVVQYITTSGVQTSTVSAYTATSMKTIITGWVKNGATPGVLQIQGLPASAANTVTYYEGSFIIAHKL